MKERILEKLYTYNNDTEIALRSETSKELTDVSRDMLNFILELVREEKIKILEYLKDHPMTDYENLGIDEGSEYRINSEVFDNLISELKEGTKW